jgi:hypothetical protein
MLKNDGSFLEKLVQAIEQSLSAGSIVEQNVHLPILGSNSAAKAQCDIVIRTGNPPRQTLTIVEVQDRNKPVTIGEFRNWQQKIRDVGAQHLYCVSRHQFSKNMKERAALSGNTIKLITLKQIEENQLPLNFFKTTVLYHDVDVLNIRKREVIFPTLLDPTNRQFLDKLNLDLATVMTNDFKFSYDKKVLKALSTICLEQISSEEKVLTKTSTLALGYDNERPFYFYSINEFNQIKLHIEYTWSFNKIEIPISVLSYDQNDFGTLAWVLESFYNSSRGPISFKIPVTRNGEHFLMSNMIITMPESVNLTMKIEKGNALK